MAADLTTPIVFDLDLTWRPADRAALELQRTAWGELRAQLLRRLQVLPEPNQAQAKKSEIVERAAVHQTILLNGSRGSGKSTFIHALRQTIKEGLVKGELAGEDKDLRELTKGLRVLRPLDPTLVEKAEHPVVSLVQVIHREVEAEQLDGPKKERREWYDEALKRLAEGLSVLEGVGKDRIYEGWEDANVVAESALTRAASGAKLASALEDYANAALAVFGKKAFLLTVDDIDTQFDRGWPMIEALRKYFNSPQFIVIIAGDIALYSLLVRGAQYQNLGDTLLRHDRAHRHHHREDDCVPWRDDPLKKMASELEAQFLMKVLKPENRISLRTLESLVRSAGEASVVLSRDRKEIGNFCSAVDNIFRAALCLSRTKDVEQHRFALLRQPVRTVAQFLVLGQALFERKPPECAEAMRFREQFSEIAGSALLQAGIRPIELIEASTVKATAMLTEWLESGDRWDKGHHLVPTYGAEEDNLVAMAFAMKFTALFSANVGNAFAYMVRVCMTRHLVLQAESKAQRRRILDFLTLNEERTIVEAGRYWVAAQRAMLPPNESVALGTIPVITGKARTKARAIEALYGQAIDPKLDAPFPSSFEPADPRVPVLKSWFEAMPTYRRFHSPASKVDNPPWIGFAYNTPQSLADNISNGRLVFSAAAVATRLGAAYTTISSVVLLGAAADAMLGEAVLSGCRAQLEAEPIAVPDFSEDGALRKFSMDSDLKKLSRDSDEASPDDDVPGGAESQDAAMAESGEPKLRLVDLFDSQGAPLFRHPAVIGRAADRYWNALLTMDESYPASAYFTGWLLERHVIALENSLLVEEAGMLVDANPLSTRNPIWNDSEFTSNHVMFGLFLAGGGENQSVLLDAMTKCKFIEHLISRPEKDKALKIHRNENLTQLEMIARAAGNVPARGLRSLWDALNTVPVAYRRKTRGPWRASSGTSGQSGPAASGGAEGEQVTTANATVIDRGSDLIAKEANQNRPNMGNGQKLQEVQVAPGAGATIVRVFKEMQKEQMTRVKPLRRRMPPKPKPE